MFFPPLFRKINHGVQFKTQKYVRLSCVLCGLYQTVLQAAIPIVNCSDLQGMQYDLAGEYELVTDIDCTGIDFFPIGTTRTPFIGKLDGKGHKISNLSINKKNTDYVGLFGVIYKNIKIQNLTLENVNILGGDYVGALIGMARIPIDNNVFNIKVQGKIAGKITLEVLLVIFRELSIIVLLMERS